MVIVVVVVGMGESTLPDGEWTEQKKDYGRLGENIVSVRPESNVYLPVDLMVTMGLPDAVRVFYKRDKVALVPCDVDAGNAYKVTKPESGKSGEIRMKWANEKLDVPFTPGHYPVVIDDGIYIIDLGGGPIND
jgi:hypothetical protein